MNLKLAKNEDKSSELEIRRTQTQAAAQRFFQIWTEYNNTQNEFRENNKKALIRNMKIIDPESNVSEAEVEQKLEAGDFTVLSSIIKESQQAKEDLKRLEDRHLEMVKLEKGIMEVCFLNYVNSWSKFKTFRFMKCSWRSQCWWKARERV